MKVKIILISLLLFSLSSVASAESLFTKNLYFGIQNDSEITKLQEFLTNEGLYSGPITGNFFSLTLKAVKAFQSREGISPTAGYFGPLTREKANAKLSIQVQASEKQAIAETGSATTPPASPKTINDAINTMQSQLNALLQQVALLQQQLQTQQQTQQSTSNKGESPQIVATTTAQDRLNAEIKSATIDFLNKEYGLKINILQAKLIDAESIPLRSEDQARTILRFCIGGQYPDFATTADIKDVLAAICASIKANSFNPTAIGIGKTTDLLRDQILILNAEISQLQNELERKLLELDSDSLNKEYSLKINTLKARLIELKSFFDESGIKIGKIRAFYYNRGEYPDFIDTDYKRQVLDESFKKADALNPIVRNDNLLTFVSEQISTLNSQITQTYNELQRKLLESQ